MWFLQKVRLHFRKWRLKGRIQTLIRYCHPDESEKLYIDLRDKLLEVERAIEFANSDAQNDNMHLSNPSLLLADLDLYITNLERKCDKLSSGEVQNQYHTHQSAKWLFWFSLLLWFFLMATNWVSMCWPIDDCALTNFVQVKITENQEGDNTGSGGNNTKTGEDSKPSIENDNASDTQPAAAIRLSTLEEVIGLLDDFNRYQWSEGWFTSDLITLFALTGVAINILITLLPSYGRKAWERTLLGTYAFRVLQATVYTALLFQIVRSLPLINKCYSVLEFEICMTSKTRTAFLLVVGFFIGLFINRLEELVIQILKPLNQRVDSQKLTSLEKKISKLHKRYIKLIPPLESNNESEYKKEIEHIEEEFETLLRLLRYLDYSLCETKLRQLELLIDRLEART